MAEKTPEERISVLETKVETQEKVDTAHEREFEDVHKKVGACFKRTDELHDTLIVLVHDVRYIKKAIEDKKGKDWALIILIITVLLNGMFTLFTNFG